MNNNKNRLQLILSAIDLKLPIIHEKALVIRYFSSPFFYITKG